MRALLVMGLLAGCIEHELVMCGDLACAPGAVCLAGERCVQTAQLTACADKDEDADCVTSGIAGRCVGGACSVVSCGNGVVESGEVCDDRNTSSGDGCNSTCSSIEICGNGIADLGEGCDCGTAGNVSTICRGENSDGAQAECSTSCELRFCGDGAMNRLEDCDGTVPTGVDCANLGFYAGELGCSALCQFDASQCTGRCNDGVLDPANEYCDPDLPLDASCLAFGFDYGRMSCSPSCGPGVTTCGRLGWQLVDPGLPRALWGGNGRIAFVRDDGSAALLDVSTGVQTNVPGGDFHEVAGAGNDIWFYGFTAVAHWTGSAFDMETSPFPAYQTPRSATASPTHGEFVLLVGGKVFHRPVGGTWSELALQGLSLSTFTHTHDEVIGIDYLQDGLRWTGSAWESLGIPAVFDATEDAQGGLIVVGTEGLYFETGSGWRTEALPAPGSAIVSDVEATWVQVAAAGAGGSGLLRLGQPAAIPLSTQGRVLALAGDGIPYAGAEVSLYSVPHGAWAERFSTNGPVSSVGSAPRLMNVNASGEHTLFIENIAGEFRDPLPVAHNCIDARLTETGRLFCLESGTLWVDETSYPSGSMTKLWVGDDDHAVLYDESTEIKLYDTGTLTDASASYYIDGIVGFHEGYWVFSAWIEGMESRRLLRFDGNDWSEFANAFEHTGVVFRPPHVLVGIAFGIRSWDITTLIDEAVDSPSFVGSFTGDANNLYMSRRVLGTTEIWHHDGTDWTQLRGPAPLQNQPSSLSIDVDITVSVGEERYQLLRTDY